MKAAFKLILLLLLGASTTLVAQRPGNPNTNPDSNFELPGAGQTDNPTTDFPAPVNDIVEKRTKMERRILPYEDVREADVMWQKRIWRVLDVREKINLPFANPQRPLITILMEAAERGDIELYGTLDDKFTTPLTEDERKGLAGGIDTVPVVNPETYEVTYELVARELNPDDIRRYRLQEIWFFDKESSTMKVRILGIAPLKDEFDENGNFLYELPMFWVYYPAARQMLANEEAYAFGNDAANRSWEDVFESRYFNSYIFKESNVLDRRIGGYLTNGRERLLEAERIKQEIFNYEQDLWSY
ncbi:gliding motility protein GldN [Lewinella sp. W8]|uniref:type IX secretion system ring protein PorN/GldN n=1 Tax=Lewinella sp. W8 TaxID=2528208 RepID=UPI001068B734|nr:gliding motility protein GldN [Lewinella sp. W8]MTB49468.1 gliding motility protein GldN [Lewinella sp. W8]